jgi:ATP-dependent DNA helicase RecG
MDDVLLLSDKVRNTLILGESHFREFKSALEGRPDSKKPRSAKSIECVTKSGRGRIKRRI